MSAQFTNAPDDGSPIADALRVGQVTGVSARTVYVQVDSNKNSPHVQYLGQVLPGVAVGSFVRIVRGFKELIGQVEGENISDNRDPDLIDHVTQGRQLKRVLTVSLIGKLDDEGRFESGVTDLPMIANPCLLLTREQLNAVNEIVTEAEDSLTVGHLVESADDEVRLGVDRLIASHVGIFGNTGSGKSNSLSLLLSSILQKYAESGEFRRLARFVMFDFSGEYLSRPGRTPLSSDTGLKREFDLGNPVASVPPLLPVSDSALEDDEFWTVVLEATQKTQVPLIRRALRNTRWDEALEDDSALISALSRILRDMTLEVSSSVEASSPAAVIESLQSVFETLLEPHEFDPAITFFRDAMTFNATQRTFYLFENSATTYSSTTSFRDRIDEILGDLLVPVNNLSGPRKVQLKILLQYHSEVARGYANREYLGPLLKRLETRIPDLEGFLSFEETTAFDHPLTIISMSKLSAESQRLVAVLVTKRLYQTMQAGLAPKGTILSIVVDEAHNVLSPVATAESDQWRDYRLAVFESVVKEGRKHATFLLLASQRPSDISHTVVSQLHNYFIHRLVNARDIDSISRLVPYLDKVSFEQLPLLSTGTCVIAGVMVERPLLVRMNLAQSDLQPVSDTIRPSEGW